MGYSPWGRKESDMTERLHFHFHFHFQGLPWRRQWLSTPIFLGFPGGSAGKEFAHSVGDLGLIPGLGRSPGEGNGYPLQFSGLENSMDCIVHGVARSYFHFLFFYLCFHAIPWLSRAPHLGC